MTVSISTRELKDWQTPWKVVHIKGRIDAFNDKRVSKTLEQIVDSGGHWLCLDLTDVEFMGFQAMQDLLKLTQAIRARAGDLVVVGPNAQVRRHLDTFTSHRGLKVFRSYEELQTGLFFVPRSEFAINEALDRPALI
jgi:anti-anti-sigma factor